MTRHLITTRESGFCNIAATTTYGDVWRDDPGEPAMTLWEVEIPEIYTNHYTDGGCVIFETANGANYLVVSGGSGGIMALDRRLCNHPLTARMVHINPITGMRDYEGS